MDFRSACSSRVPLGRWAGAGNDTQLWPPQGQVVFTPQWKAPVPPPAPFPVSSTNTCLGWGSSCPDVCRGPLGLGGWKITTWLSGPFRTHAAASGKSGATEDALCLF